MNKTYTLKTLIQKNLILKVELPVYLKRVKLSNKRRAKYYTKSSKIPKKYQGFDFDSKGRLADPMGTPIIANSRSVGTPRYKKINGQEFYKGLATPQVRATIVRNIKTYFGTHLKYLKPLEDFPIRVSIELHDIPGAKNWDLDNLWIYNKCFQDALTEYGIIPEDNMQYITAAGAPEYYPVEHELDRKLVFNIYKETRECILKHPMYEIHSQD